MRLKHVLVLLLLLTIPRPALAVEIGDIKVFYNSFTNFGLGVLDGPVFVIENTSTVDITQGALSIGPIGATADTFLA